MLSVTQWLFLAVAVVTYYLLRPKKRTLDLPGPLANYIPFIGSMVLMESRMYRALAKWTKAYGPLCKVKLGTTTFVIVGDNQIAKEMYALDAFSGRANVEEFNLFAKENVGIVPSEGPVWEEQRRFLLRQLRDFGFAKSSMESMIRDEANDLVGRLGAYNGKPVENFKDVVVLAVINSLWTIVAGTRYSQDDPKLRDLAHQLSGSFDEAAKSGALILVAGWLKYIIPEMSGYNAIRRALDGMLKFVSGTIKEHKETLQEDSPRDFIDVYLNEIKNTTDPSSSFYGANAEKQLIGVVADLFGAGTETTSTTLNWAILHLMDQPDMQKKMQAEISSVTGDSRPASFSDKPNMPYTLAFICELLRISIVPAGVPHRVMFDTEFRGTFFPKDTQILINMHYIHHDPKIWQDPDDFRPERFLTSDGKHLKKNDNLNPFLLGRRQCPGETLARDTIFLMLTAIVQTFDIVKDPDSPPLDLEPGISFSLSAKPFKAIFVERKH